MNVPRTDEAKKLCSRSAVPCRAVGFRAVGWGGGAHGETYRRPGRRLRGHRRRLHGAEPLLQEAVPLGELVHGRVPGQRLLAPGTCQQDRAAGGGSGR